MVLLYFSDLCRYLTKHLSEKHSCLDNRYHVWMAFSRLFQTHGYMHEVELMVKFRNSLDFWSVVCVAADFYGIICI